MAAHDDQLRRHDAPDGGTGAGFVVREGGADHHDVRAAVGVLAGDGVGGLWWLVLVGMDPRGGSLPSWDGTSIVFLLRSPRCVALRAILQGMRSIGSRWTRAVIILYRSTVHVLGLSEPVRMNVLLQRRYGSRGREFDPRFFPFPNGS